MNGRRSAVKALYLGQRVVRRAGCTRSRESGPFLHGSHEAVPVAAERPDVVLPHPVIGYSLADHSQAPCQRRLGDELVRPAGRQEFVFRDGAMALRQEMHEDQKRLGVEGTDEARLTQFPAVDVEGALAKHKDHGTASYGVSVLAPRASRGAGTATAVALPDRASCGQPGKPRVP